MTLYTKLDEAGEAQAGTDKGKRANYRYFILGRGAACTSNFFATRTQLD